MYALRPYYYSTAPWRQRKQPCERPPFLVEGDRGL